MLNYICIFYKGMINKQLYSLRFGDLARTKKSMNFSGQKDIVPYKRTSKTMPRLSPFNSSYNRNFNTTQERNEDSREAILP